MNFFKSLRGKLFYLMTVIILMTAIGISWRASVDFRKILLSQVEDSLHELALRTANDISNAYEKLVVQVRSILPVLQLNNKKQLTQQLEGFLLQNKDIVSIQIFQSDKTIQQQRLTYLGGGVAIRSSDPRADVKDLVKLESTSEEITAKWLAQELKNQEKSDRLFADGQKQYKLPVFNIGLRFFLNGESSQHIWLVLTIWKDTFSAILPGGSGGFEAFIISEKRGLLASNLSDIDQNLMSSSPIINLGLSGTAPSGVQTNYLGTNNQRFVGAFSLIKELNHTIVVVQKNMMLADKIINNVLLKSALYGAFFILIAIFFSFYGSAGITRALRKLTLITQQIASGDFDIEVGRTGNDEVGILGTAITSMASRIKKLLLVELRAAHVKREIETARIVQSTLFPKKPLMTEDLNIFGYYEPAGECGGDLWGYYQIKPGVTLFYIADAMGHGLPAALITAIAYAACKTIEQLSHDIDADKIKPSYFLTHINTIIFNALGGSMHMTCFLGIIDLEQGECVYGNAGHNIPILVPDNADDLRRGLSSRVLKNISNKKIISLNAVSDVPLGITGDPEYHDARILVEPLDKMILFTDGIIEGISPNGIMLGNKKFYRHVLSNIHHESLELINGILGSLTEFFGEAEQEDDMTLVTLEIRQGAKIGTKNPEPTEDFKKSGSFAKQAALAAEMESGNQDTLTPVAVACEDPELPDHSISSLVTSGDALSAGAEQGQCGVDLTLTAGNLHEQGESLVIFDPGDEVDVHGKVNDAKFETQIVVERDTDGGTIQPALQEQGVSMKIDLFDEPMELKVNEDAPSSPDILKTKHLAFENGRKAVQEQSAENDYGTVVSHLGGNLTNINSSTNVSKNHEVALDLGSDEAQIVGFTESSNDEVILDLDDNMGTEKEKLDSGELDFEASKVSEEKIASDELGSNDLPTPGDQSDFWLEELKEGTLVAETFAMPSEDLWAKSSPQQKKVESDSEIGKDKKKSA